jgi:hypothetical protein
MAGSSDAYGPCFEAPKTSKVLVLVYDQYHLSKHRDEATHNRAIVDPIASSHQLVGILRQTSHGLLNYLITDVRFVDGQPPQLATPNTADYGAIFQQENICSLVQNQNLAEMWIWGDNSAGLDELAYKVPNDAVPNDSHAESPWFYDLRKKNIPDCGKTIFVQGWNYMVGLDNALHSYNHRIESVLSLWVGQGSWYGGDTQNPWHKFSLYDLAYPGDAGVGNVHFPANAQAAYDYTNNRSVPSTALDFQDYPAWTGARTSVSCGAWGCTQLGYQQWYESLLPHASGVGYGGTCNSWWTYIADTDRRLTSCSGAACLSALGGLCALDSECASGACRCGTCAASGSNPTCPGAAFDACTSGSQCASGICGCPGETTGKACLPVTYTARCAQPAGGECWFNGDCASGICGCNGGSTVACLAAGQSAACANISNWNACTQNSDCVSGICGCFAGLYPMECLPSQAYVGSCPQ